MFSHLRNSYTLRNHKKVRMFKSEVYVPPKRLRNTDHSATLPDEILLLIFSFLSHKELYTAVRCVCKRWYVLTSSPVLWKRITAQHEVPSNILCKWIEHSPLLREVSLKERSDINTVTETLSKYCKNLQSLKIENSKGTSSELVKSETLCRLLTRCKYLNNLYFSGIKIQSCKFFKLLSNRKHFGIAKKCSYYGPVSQKQMRALIESIINSETYEAATLFTSNNRKISINELFGAASSNAVNVPGTVDHIWEDIIQNSLDEDDDEDDEDYDEFNDREPQMDVY